MINFIAIICLIAGAQGIFLGFHFLFKKKGAFILNRLIALLLLIYSLNLVNTYCYLSNFHLLHNVLQPIANYLGWWVGPSIWLYVTYPHLEANWRKIILIHYAPVLIIALVGELIPDSIQWIAIGFYIQFSIYVGVSLYFYYKNKVDKRLFEWLVIFVYTVAIIKLANISVIFYEVISKSPVDDIYKISLIVIAVIPIFIMAYWEMNMAKSFEPHYEKYGESGVVKSDIGKYFHLINDKIQSEKLFLNPSFKIADLSKVIDLNSRKISQVINENQKMNFSTFINQFRLEEVRERLLQEEYNHLSILGIAQDCGFKSGGRFNTLFKEKFGETPSEYRKSKQKLS